VGIKNCRYDKAEGRGQKVEGRRQKVEGRRQKAEGRRQKGRGFWTNLLFVTYFVFLCLSTYYLEMKQKIMRLIESLSFLEDIDTANNQSILEFQTVFLEMQVVDLK